MLSAQRLKEFCSTLRFRLVLWITLVVFFMVVVTSITVRVTVQRALRNDYDQFLEDSLKVVQFSVQKQYPHDKQTLFASLGERVNAFQHRGWLVQLYDDQERLIWPTATTRYLPVTKRIAVTSLPFDLEKHRIIEARTTDANGDLLFIRCGFYQTTLQEDIDLLHRVVLFGGLAILLAAPLGGYFIALRATRPISQIIASTAGLQPNNMDERLPIRGTGDEIDQLSQTINGMLDRLASYIDHNRDFVANAAHELRSPLAAIRSSVEVALNRKRSPEEYAATLTEVMEEISGLASLVNRLLILAEGDAGRSSGTFRVTDLQKIVRESVDMFGAVAEAKGVRLTIGEMCPAVVRGDDGYVRQVVRNLIDNAIKYTQDSGKVTVRLRVDSLAKQAILVIQDSGIGIERDVLPRIFDRFYRADRSRRRESDRSGVGLGLSICDAIVKSLCGEIVVESEFGRGSTFSVRLPLAGSAPPSASRTP